MIRIALRSLIPTEGLLMAQTLAAGGFDQTLRDFTRDISANDPTVITQFEAIIETPPTSLVEVRFYGGEDASAEERQFRAMIIRLNEVDHILASASLSLPNPLPAPFAKSDPKSLRDLTYIGYQP
ncbi:MAG TPA: hypothetical protein DHC76_16305 [Rhodobacteraceae bacterium]|jgi:hypothetical protein|nr:hypothetical protein [Paracoccaceae bacterium]